MNTITLTGCRGETLLDYLKAIGIMSVVRQHDGRACRCRWSYQGFEILTSFSNKEDLLDFVVNDYVPTPIIVPWSGNDFFGIRKQGDPGPYQSTPTASRVIEAVLATTSHRLQQYREVILGALGLMKTLGIEKKEQMKDETKVRFLTALRARLPDEFVGWIDSCTAVTSGGEPIFNVLFGSGGGNDGNTHFSDNFMQNLWDVLPDFDPQRAQPPDPNFSRSMLADALFADKPVRGLIGKRTSSLYHPGAVGGANAGQGYERDAIANPWNFILCLEGALSFSGSASRRYASTGASFPFLVRMTPDGTGGTVNSERGGYEIWLPLWHGWASCDEVRFLLSEGRTLVARRGARYGVDVARAIASLGVDRGVSGFQRVSIVRGRVGGTNYYTSANLGFFPTRFRREVDLLVEVDSWLSRFRSAVSGDKIPPRFPRALWRIESAILEFCRYGGASRFAEILCALGQAERELARGEKFRGDHGLRPIPVLSPRWLEAANDRSVEFELALSLASIGASGGVGTLRSNLEPVTLARVRDGSLSVSWSDRDPGVVWTAADLPTNLRKVLERRLLDARRVGARDLPLRARWPASLDAVIAFIQGEVDDDRVEQLVWGLILVDHGADYPSSLSHWTAPGEPLLDRRYALLKLIFSPGPLQWEGSSFEIGWESSVIPLLRSGRIREACATAMRRLRVSGLIPMPHRLRSGKPRDGDWEDLPNPTARRFAASLLFGIAQSDMQRLMGLVLRRKEEQTLEILPASLGGK